VAGARRRRPHPGAWEGGLVPSLLAALGVDAPALRRAVAKNGEPGGA
jgi:hypothetical protein